MVNGIRTMAGRAFSKVMLVGKVTVFAVGLAVILAAVVGTADAALAANGQSFILGKTNVARAVSKLVKQGPGPALELATRPGQAPLKVNSRGKVANLNADTVDGLDSTQLRGQAGPQGERGSQGPAGPQGPKGDPSYKRTVLVSPVPGDAAASGAALQNALNGITGASATNPYLLKIEPGVYDMGTSPLVMKQWVDIEGSGEGVTTIKRAGASTRSTGTVEGANNAELRFLTVENTGGQDFAVAIFNENASPRLTHVTAKAAGGNETIGVLNFPSSPTMAGVTATAASGGIDSFGVANFGASPVIRDSTLEARGASSRNSALFSLGSSGTVRVDNSLLVAAGTSNTTVFKTDAIATRVGASRLDGGPVQGTVTCAGVYDENYAFFPNTCP